MRRVMSLFLLLLAIPIVSFGDEFRPIVIPPGSSLVEALRNDNQHFSKLIALAEKSGMKELTARGQRFTLLAPTNEAFDKLPKGEYDALIKNPAMLKRFLAGHLFAGKVLFKNLFEPATPAEQGQKLTKELRTIDGSIVSFLCDGIHSSVHHP